MANASSVKKVLIHELKSDDDRALLSFIEGLRDDYHAHAGHTPERQMIDSSALLGATEGRPGYVESWTVLSVDVLRRVADLACRQEADLTSAAEHHETELSDS